MLDDWLPTKRCFARETQIPELLCAILHIQRVRQGALPGGVVMKARRQRHAMHVIDGGRGVDVHDVVEKADTALARADVQAAGTRVRVAARPRIRVRTLTSLISARNPKKRVRSALKVLTL